MGARPTLSVSFSYGFSGAKMRSTSDRQHAVSSLRVAIVRAVPAGMQGGARDAGGSLHVAIAVAQQLSTAQSAGDRLQEVLVRRLFILLQFIRELLQTPVCGAESGGMTTGRGCSVCRAPGTRVVSGLVFRVKTETRHA